MISVLSFGGETCIAGAKVFTNSKRWQALKDFLEGFQLGGLVVAASLLAAGSMIGRLRLAASKLAATISYSKEMCPGKQSQRLPVVLKFLILISVL